MECLSRVLKFNDQYNLMNLKTINNGEIMKRFKKIKACLIDNDKEADNKIVVYKQNNEILNLCVYDIEITTQKKISELRVNVVVSAVGYETCNDNDIEEVFLYEKLVI